MTLKPTIPNGVQSQVPAANIETLRKLARETQTATKGAALSVQIGVGAEAVPAADDRVFTFQTVASNGQSCRGVFGMLVWISDTEGGAPAGTQTTAWTSGVVLKELVSTQCWLVATGLDGTAALKVNVTGGATRYAHAIALPPAVCNGPTAWEA